MQCLLIAAACAVSGCGDDSSSDPLGPGVGTTSATGTFPLAKVRANLINRGYVFDCNISGTAAGLPASGQETISLSQPEAITFEGQAGALKNSRTEVGSITIAGRPQGISTLLAFVVSSNYVPLGAISGAGEYWLVRTPPTTTQTDVKVGDLLNTIVYTVYANQQKILTKGRVELSGSIDADTQNTAVLTEVYTTYNIANTVEQTETFRYKMDQNGNVRPFFKSLVLNNLPGDSTVCK